MVSTTRDTEVFLLTPGDHPSSSDPEPSQRPGTILVVEDDAPTLRLERVVLEEAGYAVEVAATGEEAIEAVAALKPDLVILDIGLPGMDGFATCRRIRDISRVPIIMVTGRGGVFDKVSGMNLGADDYVTKPFLAIELAARVRVLLRRTLVMKHLNQHTDSSAPGPPPVSLSPTEISDQDGRPTPADEVPPARTSPPTGRPQLEPPENAHSEPPSSPPPGIDATKSSGAAPLSVPPGVKRPLPGNEARPAPPSGDEAVYEGTVRLSVTTRGPVSNLIAFVGELRQNPQYRVLRLVANQHQAGMDVWLGLRQPAPLLSSLMEIEGVTGVTSVGPPLEPTEDGEPVLSVYLR
jgi:CheY-like chemotaxis protein